MRTASDKHQRTWSSQTDTAFNLAVRGIERTTESCSDQGVSSKFNSPFLVWSSLPDSVGHGTNSMSPWTSRKARRSARRQRFDNRKSIISDDMIHRRDVHNERGGGILRSGYNGNVHQQPKNALMQLNELRPVNAATSGLKFKQISRSGPDHSPTFTASLEFKGQVYDGTGQTKRIARQMAAERAVCSLIQFRRQSDAVGQVEVVMAANMRCRSMTSNRMLANNTEDFTSDDPNGVTVLFNRFDGFASDGDSNSQSSMSMSPDSVDLNSDRSRRAFSLNLSNGSSSPLLNRCSSDTKLYTAGLHSNPVAILNDLRPGTEYRVLRDNEEALASTSAYDCWRWPSAENRSTKNSFSVSLTVDGNDFIGSGWTKRSAKRRAATNALRTVFRLRHVV